MTYILLIVIWGGSGIGTEAIYFNSLKSCQAAADVVTHDFERFNTKTVECIPDERRRDEVTAGRVRLASLDGD